MTTGSHFTVRRVGDVQIIEFTGAADHLLDLERSKEALYSLIEACAKPRCILDFHNVEWGGSRVIGVIMQFNLMILRQQGQLHLCGLRPNMKQVLDLTRVSAILSIHSTCEDALKKIQ